MLEQCEPGLSRTLRVYVAQNLIFEFDKIGETVSCAMAFGFGFGFAYTFGLCFGVFLLHFALL